MLPATRWMGKVTSELPSPLECVGKSVDKIDNDDDDTNDNDNNVSDHTDK